MDPHAADFHGADINTSFVAEVYAGLMARLWLLQSNLDTNIPVTILYDNASAADVISGKCIGRSVLILCKISCAIHRHSSYLYHICDHHIKSHYRHPWNEYVDCLCTFFTEKPQESRVSVSPISLVDSFKAFCIDLASVNECEQISSSLQAHANWQPTIQKALKALLIASRIDKHEYDKDSSTISMYNLYTLQYNIKTLTKYGDRKVFLPGSPRKKLPSLLFRKLEKPTLVSL